MFIVLTDFLCWMPIIVIGLLSLLGKFHDPEKQAYVWIAVFVLPVNSALNPILYTFSTPLVKRKVGEHTDSLTSFLERTVWRRKRNPGVLSGTLSKGVFERRTSTGSGLFCILGQQSGFAQILGQIISVRQKTFSNTHMLTSRNIKRKQSHFRLRPSFKTPFLKLLLTSSLSFPVMSSVVCN